MLPPFPQTRSQFVFALGIGIIIFFFLNISIYNEKLCEGSLTQAVQEARSAQNSAKRLEAQRAALERQVQQLRRRIKAFSRKAETDSVEADSPSSSNDDSSSLPSSSPSPSPSTSQAPSSTSAAAPAPAPAPPSSAKCVFEPGFSREGGDINWGDQNKQQTQEECCKSCLDNPACVAFTYNSVSHACWLKGVANTRSPFRDAVSGTVQGRSSSSVPAGGGGAAVPMAASSGQYVVPALPATFSKDNIAVVVIACRRPQYLSRALKSIISAVGEHKAQYPIYVSQDGADEGVLNLLKGEFSKDVLRMQHINTAEPQTLPGENKGYYLIARHFRWALTTLFDKLGYEQVIILEEDIEVAPDFFSFFAATLPTLKADQSLYCVSAWNDNGREGLVADPHAIYRTDVFPGLGWMMTKSIWQELGPKWPPAYWDDWMRTPSVRNGRSCLFPEVARSYTFGEQGVSMGEFYNDFLRYIKLNKDPVEFSEEDVAHLKQEEYQEWLKEAVAQATEVTLENIQGHIGKSQDVKLYYSHKGDYIPIAVRFGLMQDDKEGMLRTSYRDVLVFKQQGTRIFLVKRGAWPEDS